MALPKPKKGEKPPDSLSASEAVKQPKYPWGLEIRLEDAAIKKLGLRLKDFDTDTVVHITARAETTRVSEDDTVSGGKTQSLSFQITDMGIEREGEDGFAEGWRKGVQAKDAARKAAGGSGR
jgi:hypothetical protein